MITLLITLLIIGVLLYVVSLIPMNDIIRKIIYAVSVLIALLVVLDAFNLVNFNWK